MNRIDILFIGGDFANIQHKDIEEEEEEEEMEKTEDRKRKRTYEETLLQVLSALSIPILWIPGNHDSTESFFPTGGMNKETVNIHNRVIQIAEDLYVAGFGGSVSALDNQKQLVWKGYPVAKGDFNVSQLQKSIAKLPKSSSLVIMTHNPPKIAPTSVLYSSKLNKKIFTGSRKLDSLVTTALQHMNVPVVLHGHCHYAIGSNLYISKFGQTKILTAGAFKNSDAASFSLVRVAGKWELASQTLFNVAFLEREELGSL